MGMSAAQVIPEEARRTYLGSHDTSAIFGLNPWRGPINVYMDKLGMSVQREDTPEQLQWGIRLQPAILDMFGERMGCQLEPERFIRHPDMAWFGGTPDATIAGEKAGVDAKNIRWNRGEWGEEGTDAVPEYVAMQCHHFMTLLGYERWYVAALFGGCEFKFYEVVRDDDIADMIVKADSEFWHEHIEGQTPPDLDGSASYRKYIERKYPRDNGDVRTATPDEIDLLDKYRRQSSLLARRESKVEELKSRLCASVGESAGIVCDLGRVSYKTAKGRTTLDGKRLKDEMPEVAKQYEKTGSTYRILRITLKEDE